MVLRKVVVAAVLAGLVTFVAGAPIAQAAAKKVDCSKVMSELSSGKKPAEVAKELGISRSSVYRCRRQAKAAEKKAAPEAAAPAPGAAAPAPEAAAPAPEAAAPAPGAAAPAPEQPAPGK